MELFLSMFCNGISAPHDEQQQKASLILKMFVFNESMFQVSRSALILIFDKVQ